MAVMRAFERVSRELLLWIHDQAGADTRKTVDPGAFPGRDERVGLDAAVEYLVRQGLVEPRRRRSASGPVTLTPYGLDVAVREKSRPHRRRRARANLLRWAYDQPAARHAPGADVTLLARDPRSVIDGEMMTIEELNAAARDLRDAGLATISGQDMNGGFAIGLTEAGIAQVERHGREMPLAAPVPNQAGGALLGYAQAVRQAVPALHLGAATAGAVTDAAEAIETELGRLTPDADAVNAAATTIRTALRGTTDNALAALLLRACPP
jgi:hypothetical protein